MRLGVVFAWLCLFCLVLLGWGWVCVFVGLFLLKVVLGGLIFTFPEQGKVWFVAL